MPIDSRGRWVPPADATWLRDDVSEQQLWKDLKDGKIPGISSKTALRDLFPTKAWKDLTPSKQLQVVQVYQDNYHDSWTETEKASSTWGLELEYNTKYDEGSRFDAQVWFQHYIGKFGDDSDIDYGHYNTDPLMVAARHEGARDNPELFGMDGRVPYNDPAEIWAGLQIVEGMSLEEKADAYDWAKATDHTYTELEAIKQKYKQTRFFDEDTLTTTIRDRHTGLVKETHTHKPLGSPNRLNIVIGDPPVEKYDDDGTRIAGFDDLKRLYKRYLGRPPDLEAISHWSDKPLQEVEYGISRSKEAKAGGYKDRGQVFYNPQKYGTEESIKATMATPAEAPKPPTITIRQISSPQELAIKRAEKGGHSALPKEWLTTTGE